MLLAGRFGGFLAGERLAMDRFLVAISISTVKAMRSVSGADPGPRAGSPRGVVDATGLTHYGRPGRYPSRY
jgi:hypothetical protein